MVENSNLPAEKPKRFGHHHNAFGFLRLALASLVIVSHTAEIIYGDRSHEPLTMLAGTISFGDLAVYGFFIVSGYLITGSFLKTPSIGNYLAKRIARIYPAFIVASLVCVIVIAPLGGSPLVFSRHAILNFIKNACLLLPPSAENAFAGSHYPVLNGSMWTIIYEFHCYLLVLLLGVLGILRIRAMALVIGIALLLTMLFCPPAILAEGDAHFGHLLLLVGLPSRALPLTVMFVSGMLFYLFREEIRVTRIGLAIALALLIAGLFVQATAHLAVATAGAYAIFAIASIGGQGVLARINNENDVSYGVYLYAWPLTKLLAWYFPTLASVAVALITWLGAMLLGTMSWFLVEKPIMRAVQTWLRSRPKEA